MEKGKNSRLARYCLLAVVALSLVSCKGINDIKVTSCGLASLTPKGFRSADAVLALGIDNPIIPFTLSDLKGEIVREDQLAATFSAGTINVEGKTEKIYYFPCSASIDKSVSILDLVALAAKQDFSEYSINIEFTVSTRSGVGKKMKFDGIAISELIGK